MISYDLMKKHQTVVDPVYLPSRHWQENLHRSFADIEAAIQRGKSEAVASFLGNCLRDRSLGISVEAAMDFRSRTERIIYLNALHSLYSFWRYCYPDSPITSIAMPLIGNPRGYCIDGQLINTASFFNQTVAEELSGLIAAHSRPVVAEIGGGYGPMGYALLRRFGSITYLDFDLPEMIAIASYFMATAFPSRRILLYGERDFTDSCLVDFDIILLPNYAITDLAANSCDLCVNQASFGEMNRATVLRYLSHITHCCRGAFYHLNHEYQADTHSDDPGLLARAYPLSRDDFTLIYRTLHIPHYFFYREMYRQVVDIFAYLYVKRC